MTLIILSTVTFLTGLAVAHCHREDVAVIAWGEVCRFAARFPLAIVHRWAVQAKDAVQAAALPPPK